MPFISCVSPFGILMGFLWTCSSLPVCPVLHGTKLYSTCGLTSAKQKEIITSLDLLFVLSLTQLKLQSVLIALRVHCWLMFNLLSDRVSKSFSAELLPVHSAAVMLYRVFAFPNARHVTFVFV